MNMVTKIYTINNDKKLTVEYDEQEIAKVTKAIIEQAFVPALEKAEKYKWHDLQKQKKKGTKKMFKELFEKFKRKADVRVLVNEMSRIKSTCDNLGMCGPECPYMGEVSCIFKESLINYPFAWQLGGLKTIAVKEEEQELQENYGL